LSVVSWTWLSKCRESETPQRKRSRLHMWHSFLVLFLSSLSFFLSFYPSHFYFDYFIQLSTDENSLVLFCFFLSNIFRYECVVVVLSLSFGCGELPHAPADCKMVKEWKKKLAQEGDTAHFLASYTKECPKCNTSSTLSLPFALISLLFTCSFIRFC
jgi:hypothetical protein